MHHMSGRRALMLALIGSAAAVAVAACSSPAVTTTPSTSAPAAATKEFTSEWYGFSVTLTEEWSGTDATLDWNGEKLQGLTSPAFARFADAPSGRTLVAAAAPVAAGTELADWRDAMVRAAPASCSESESVEETTLGGEPALVWSATCGDGDAIKLAALHEGRGYMIFLDSQTATDDEDRNIFEMIRSSFRFTS
jgi:RNA polymerase subunit RPABC4/transcription elongation factor Spt4